MKPSQRAIGLLAFAATAAVLVPTATPADAAPRTHTIVMANMRFGPVPAGVKAGDTIIWVNRDVVPHTATARDGSFDIVLAGRQSRQMRITRSGTFAVYCRYHPAMRASLAVAR